MDVWIDAFPFPFTLALCICVSGNGGSRALQAPAEQVFDRGEQTRG